MLCFPQSEAFVKHNEPRLHAHAIGWGNQGRLKVALKGGTQCQLWPWCSGSAKSVAARIRGCDLVAKQIDRQDWPSWRSLWPDSSIFPVSHLSSLISRGNFLQRCTFSGLLQSLILTPDRMVDSKSCFLVCVLYALTQCRWCRCGWTRQVRLWTESSGGKSSIGKTRRRLQGPWVIAESATRSPCPYRAHR